MIVAFDIEEQILFLKENNKIGQEYAFCIISCIKSAIKKKMITVKTANIYIKKIDEIVQKKIEEKELKKENKLYEEIFKEANKLSGESKVKYCSSLINKIIDQFLLGLIARKKTLYILKGVYKIVPFEELKLKYDKKVFELLKLDV